MKRPLIILVAALAALTAAQAEPVTLTRVEAVRLHDALQAISPGLTPDNTFLAADNLTALAPHADAFRKADTARARTDARIRAAAGEEAAKVEKLLALGESFDAKSEDKLTVDLARIEISREEVKEAKIPPAVLTQLRRFLAPAPKK